MYIYIIYLHYIFHDVLSLNVLKLKRSIRPMAENHTKFKTYLLFVNTPRVGIILAVISESYSFATKSWSNTDRSARHQSQHRVGGILQKVYGLITGILEKGNTAITWKIMMRSNHNLAFVTTAELSFPVQMCDLKIILITITTKRIFHKISVVSSRTLSEMGPRVCMEELPLERFWLASLWRNEAIGQTRRKNICGVFPPWI